METLDVFSVRELRTRSGDLLKDAGLGRCRSSRSTAGLLSSPYRLTGGCWTKGSTAPWH